MIDAVLSWPLNSWTSGVAKFNHRLAQALGVPCLGVADMHQARHPLVSLKIAEWPPDAMWGGDGSYAFFAHDADPSRGDFVRFVTRATTVYAANGVIAQQLRVLRPDIVAAWCPATIQGNPTRGQAIRVLTFGMAHKLVTPYYHRLHTLLEESRQSYTVAVSTAVHEGSPWDATGLVGQQLREIFGLQLRVLGYLADDALIKELTECTHVALFFDPALRANNTSFWAACAAAKPVITNCDADSPIQTPLDIQYLRAWPPTMVLPNMLAWEAAHSWAPLVSLLTAQPVTP